MKTTKANFETFKKHIKHYIKVFGLQRYELYFEHSKLEDGYAQTNPGDMHNATITLNTKVENDFKSDLDIRLKRWALHEVLHLTHYRLRSAAFKRYTTENEISEADEEAVAIIEKVIRKYI